MAIDITRPVLLVDLSAPFHAAYRAIPETEPINRVVDSVLGVIRKAIALVPDAYVGICCDSRGNWRKKVSPEYKAQREKLPSSFYAAMDDLKRRLHADGHLLWECADFEADDVIATACDAATLAGHRVTIVTPDKDLSQLSQEQVTMVSTAYDPWVTRDRAAVMEKFGVAPHLMADLLALCGDKSDNVKGAAGIGATTGALLINTFGTIEKIYEAAHDLVDVATNPFWRTSNGKAPLAMHDKLLKSEADVRLAKKLVTLRYDAPIRFEDIYEHREIQPLTTTTDAEFDDMISPGPGPATDSTAINIAPTAETAGPAVEKQPVPAAAQPPSAPAAGSGQTALVVSDQKAELSLALSQFDAEMQPTGMAGMYWFARRAARSGLYPDYRDENAALMAMARGMDFRLSPAAAMETIRVVKGHLCVSAHVVIDRARSHPDCEYLYFKDKSETSATCVSRSRRNPEGVVTMTTYTVEMAKKAGLFKPGGAWDMHGGRMCVKMAGVFAAREDFPGAAGGFAIEELEAS